MQNLVLGLLFSTKKKSAKKAQNEHSDLRKAVLIMGENC